MGVACLKLEGRMKRPEYVAVVTRIYANAIKENREPTGQELEELELAFSRQGFTDGYYMDRKGPHMFGVRLEEPEPKELFARARATYENGENRKEPVEFFAQTLAGQPAQAAVRDREGHLVTVEGPVPEPAVNVPLTREKVEGQLSRTGGTPYACQKVLARVDEGLSVPLSALNAMRRQALEELSRQRVALPERRTGPFRPGVRYEDRRQPPVFTLSLRSLEQISSGLLALSPALDLSAGGGAGRPPGGVGAHPGRGRPRGRRPAPDLLGPGVARPGAGAEKAAKAGGGSGPVPHLGRRGARPSAGTAGAGGLRPEHLQQPGAEAAASDGPGVRRGVLRAEAAPDPGLVQGHRHGVHRLWPSVPDRSRRTASSTTTRDSTPAPE